MLVGALPVSAGDLGDGLDAEDPLLLAAGANAGSFDWPPELEALLYESAWPVASPRAFRPRSRPRTAKGAHLAQLDPPGSGAGATR